MRRTLLLLAALAAAHLLLLTITPSGATIAPEGDGLDIGIVFDVGGRGDKSFNDGAYLGGLRAADSLGARVRYIEPGEGSDREAGLRLLAAEGMDLVIGVGFIFTDDILTLAREYPDVQFAGVDYAVAVRQPRAIRCRSRPTSWRSSSARRKAPSSSARWPRSSADRRRSDSWAAWTSPLIHKFEAGYRAGVKHVCPDCSVIAQYAGVTPEAFKNPGQGQGTGAQPVPAGRERDLPRLRLHRARRLRGGAHHRQAGHRRGRRPVRRGAGPRAHVHGEGRSTRPSSTSIAARAGRAPSKAASACSGWPSVAWATCTTTTTVRSFPTAVRARLQALEAEIIAGRIRVPSTR